MNVEKYLKVIDVELHKPSFDYLNELLRAHQKTISFNNLAVFYHPGKILNLEIDELFEKVIIRGEGGYCFENNKMFYHLLKGLGFTVEAKAARVIYDKTGDVPRTHRTTIVTIGDRRYLADVGFGKDVPPKAVPLDDAETTGHHVIIREHDYLLKNKNINLYVFDDGTYQESDFVVANFYTNTHPDSKFVKELIVTRRDGEDIEFINGKTYTQIKNEVRQNFEIRSQSEFDTCLKRFNIIKSFNFGRL